MEQLNPPRKSRFTADEYLQIEEVSQTKHEFRNGQIIDMAGGTFDHALIASNMLSAITTRLKGKPCNALGSDLRVKIPGKPHYCYPDVTIVCGPPRFDPPDRKTTITNPQIVIEVSSPSTIEDDRFDKFDDYMRIDSLQEYILVAQDRMRVKSFYLQSDGIWAIGPTHAEPDASVTLRSLGISIPLTEIYAGIDFYRAEARSPF